MATCTGAPARPRAIAHREKQSSRKAAIAAAFLASSWTASGIAAEWWNSDSTQRAGSWETSFGVSLTGSERSDGLNGSSLDVDSGWGIGASIGYNFNDHFALNFDGSWIRADYDAVLDTEDDGLVEISHELDVFNGQFSAIYNLLPGPFTPYLQAGIGWTYVDSNVIDGPPTTGCWWDPWWGYICSNFYSTYSETNFSWNAGAGLRYDMGNGMFLRGGWQRTHLDGGAGADPRFDAFRFELGWLF